MYVSLSVSREGGCQWSCCDGYSLGEVGELSLSALHPPVPLSVLPVPARPASWPRAPPGRGQSHGPGGSHPLSGLRGVAPSGGREDALLACAVFFDISLECSGSCQQGAVAPHTLTPHLCFPTGARSSPQRAVCAAGRSGVNP